jgi:hypothetical protein
MPVLSPSPALATSPAETEYFPSFSSPSASQMEWEQIASRSSRNTRRDNEWLQRRVESLQETYYADMRVGYPIVARFGTRARYRYGCIYSRDQTCHILLNRLFAHPDVPDYVLDATLVHELAHYAHGWGSGQPKLYTHPHRGGVVEAEMKKRGCYALEEQAGVWRKSCWQSFYVEQSQQSEARKQARVRRDTTLWEEYLQTPGFRTESFLRDRLAVLSIRFGFAAPPLEVGWLLASLRRHGLSYGYTGEGTVRLHGTLADPQVPDFVVDYELCYWLAFTAGCVRWNQIEDALRNAEVWSSAQKAILWRRKIWGTYYPSHHPLRSK